MTTPGAGTVAASPWASRPFADQTAGPVSINGGVESPGKRMVDPIATVHHREVQAQDTPAGLNTCLGSATTALSADPTEHGARKGNCLKSPNKVTLRELRLLQWSSPNTKSWAHCPCNWHDHAQAALTSCPRRSNSRSQKAHLFLTTSGSIFRSRSLA